MTPRERKEMRIKKGGCFYKDSADIIRIYDECSRKFSSEKALKEGYELKTGNIEGADYTEYIDPETGDAVWGTSSYLGTDKDYTDLPNEFMKLLED